jgi:hypothetical protein
MRLVQRSRRMQGYSVRKRSIRLLHITNINNNTVRPAEVCFSYIHRRDDEFDIDGASVVMTNRDSDLEMKKKKVRERERERERDWEYVRT